MSCNHVHRWVFLVKSAQKAKHSKWWKLKTRGCLAVYVCVCCVPTTFADGSLLQCQLSIWRHFIKTEPKELLFTCHQRMILFKKKTRICTKCGCPARNCNKPQPDLSESKPRLFSLNFEHPTIPNPDGQKWSHYRTVKVTDSMSRNRTIIQRQKWPFGDVPLTKNGSFVEKRFVFWCSGWTTFTFWGNSLFSVYHLTKGYLCRKT